MTYDSIVQELMREFEQQPVDFVSQQDVQSHLFSMLREQLSSRNGLRAQYHGNPLKMSHDDSIPNYKLPYFNRMKNDMSGHGFPITRIHAQARIKDLSFWVQGNEAFDLIILEDALSNPIEWSDGYKRFDSVDIEAAFEFNFVRNHPFPKSGIPFDELSSASTVDIENGIWRKYEPIIQDIRGLNELQSVNEKYMLILSNYDFLYQGNISDDNNTKQKKYNSIGDTARNVFSSEAQNGGTRIYYAYPDGYTRL